MIRSLMRPTTNSCPSTTKPRSPARTNCPGSPGSVAAQHLGRGRGILPVARAHAGPLDPDLPHAAEPVAGIERLATESRRRGLRQEAIEDIGAHRLGAIERHVVTR